MKYYFNRDKSTGILEKIDIATGKVIETFGDDYSSAMVHEGRDMVRVGGELKSVTDLTVNRHFGYEYSELMAGAVGACRGGEREHVRPATVSRWLCRLVRRKRG